MQIRPIAIIEEYQLNPITQLPVRPHITCRAEAMHCAETAAVRWLNGDRRRCDVLQSTDDNTISGRKIKMDSSVETS